jgi:hypothetical protein
MKIGFYEERMSSQDTGDKSLYNLRFKGFWIDMCVFLMDTHGNVYSHRLSY